MTVEEAREELRTVRKLKARESAISRQIVDLKEELYRFRITDYERERVCSSGGKDRATDLISRIDELERKAQECLLDLFSERFATEKKIAGLPHPHSEVLTRYYVDGQRQERIAVEMNYSFPYVRRLLSEGVKKYAKLEKRVQNDTKNMI